MKKKRKNKCKKDAKLPNKEIKKKAKIKKPKFMRNLAHSIDKNTENEEIAVSPEETKFWGEFYKKFGRRVYSEGDLDGLHVFWADKIDNGYKVYATDDPENPDCEVFEFDVESLPKEISWIRKLSDQGLTVNGRKRHPEDDEPQPKNSTAIAEIISSVRFKYERSYHKLYLIRYLTEWMGSAVFVKREELLTASLMLKSFEQQEKIKKRRIMEYELEYGGFTAKKPPQSKCKKINMQSEKLYVKNDDKNNENTEKNEKNIEMKKKKRGRKRVYAVHSKHRTWELNKAQIELRKEGTCVFYSLKCLCPKIPQKNCGKFYSNKAKKWKGIKKIIFSLIKKYCPGFSYKIVKEMPSCNVTLNNMIAELLKEKNGNYLFLYRVKNSMSGHSGVIKNGILNEIYERKIKVGHNPGDYRVEFEEQKIVRDDLKREICEFYSIKIEENNNEKFE